MKTIEISDALYSEFEYLAELLQKNPTGSALTKPDEIIRYVLISVANGSSRPGSWERGLLESMNLVSNAAEHHVYRTTWGKPR